jgi:DUF1680 family protein
VPSDLYSFTGSDAKKITIMVNGQPAEYTMQDGYAVINRTWKKEDKVSLTLPMQVQRITANEKLSDDIGKTALQRGPLVYCAEWTDNNGKASNLILPAGTGFSTEYRKDMFNGITVIKAEVPAVQVTNNRVETKTQSFTAIPYYSWANRGKGEMMIWFPQQVKSIELLTH